MSEKNDSKLEVLFVCTGNTCRSPMAEGILKMMLKDKGVGNVKVSSAGTHGLRSAPASLFAIEVAKRRNVDLSRHRSRELTAEMVGRADLILTMSQEHLERIKRMDKQAGQKAYLLKAFPQPHTESNDGQNHGVLSIKDPIGGSLDDYEDAFSEIEKEMERILPELLRLVTKS
jgi:protein-tyrosine-phosphatase